MQHPNLCRIVSSLRRLLEGIPKHFWLCIWSDKTDRALGHSHSHAYTHSQKKEEEKENSRSGNNNKDSHGTHLSIIFIVVFFFVLFSPPHSVSTRLFFHFIFGRHTLLCSFASCFFCLPQKRPQNVYILDIGEIRQLFANME